MTIVTRIDRSPTGGGEVRAILYARCSTDAQANSGLGLVAQTQAMHAAVTLRGWHVVAELQDTASGGSLERPALQQALALIDCGEADALMVSRLDRATRSVGDFATVLGRLERRGAAFVALDLGIDSSTPGGRLVASVIASVAEWERSVISERTRAALRQLPRERRNGRPVFDESVRLRARVLRKRGLSLAKIAARLEREGVRPVRGGTRLHATTVARLLRDD